MTGFDAAATIAAAEAAAAAGQVPAVVLSHSTWQSVDLAGVLAGERTDPAPSILRREDKRGLLYPGKVHSFAGESESLKSWLLLVGIAQEILAGNHALYLDFEDTAETVVDRLRALGCSSDGIVKCLDYRRPAEPIGEFVRELLDDVRERRHTLAVIDGVTEGMTLHGLDLYGNRDAAEWFALLPRPLADAGPAVGQIDHVVKSKEDRGRYAIGAGHKLAGLDGAAYTVELVEPFGRGKHGSAKVWIAKDRPGRVREHCPGRLAATLSLSSKLDDSVVASLDPPVERDPAAPFRPTVLMARVSTALAGHPAGLSKRAVRGAVTGKNDVIDLALETLVAEGYVATSAGARGAVLYVNRRLFGAEK